MGAENEGRYRWWLEGPDESVRVASREGNRFEIVLRSRRILIGGFGYKRARNQRVLNILPPR